MITNRFETILADTDAARAIHYNVRYKVFCEETGFEDAARFPDQKEQDQFDAHAQHFIVWDRLRREWAGAMRLVDPAKHRMPCETICRQPLAGLDARRHKSVEFSRLCIAPSYRTAEYAFQFGMAAPDHDATGPETAVLFRQEENEVFLRLVRAGFEWGMANGADHLYFLVNRALARVLKRCGIPLEVVGDPVEHRGTRLPHSCNVYESDAGMAATVPGYARLARHSAPYVRYSEFMRRPAAVPAKVGEAHRFRRDLTVASHSHLRGAWHPVEAAVRHGQDKAA